MSMNNFKEWLVSIIEELNAEDIVDLPTEEEDLEVEFDLEPGGELRTIYAEYLKKVSTASNSDRDIIEQEFAIRVRGILLEAAGTNEDDYFIDQEVARMMDNDDS